jgi:hypothetical protein
MGGARILRDVRRPIRGAGRDFESRLNRVNHTAPYVLTSSRVRHARAPAYDFKDPAKRGTKVVKAAVTRRLSV